MMTNHKDSPSQTTEEAERSVTPSSKPDWGFRIFVAALAMVAVWLIAMPFVTSIAKLTMERFHLRTGSFTIWALQQPIPSMYSFANTTEVRNFPYDAKAKSLVDPFLIEPLEVLKANDEELPFGVIAARTINHFPTREFTFANARARFLQDDASKWFVLKSSYRGQKMESTYYLERATEGGWTAQLLEEDQ